MVRRTQQSGPVSDPLVWLVGKALDLSEYLIRRLVEASLNGLPKPKRELHSRAMKWVARLVAAKR